MTFKKTVCANCLQHNWLAVDLGNIDEHKKLKKILETGDERLSIDCIFLSL